MTHRFKKIQKFLKFCYYNWRNKFAAYFKCKIEVQRMYNKPDNVLGTNIKYVHEKIEKSNSFVKFAYILKTLNFCHFFAATI